MIKVPHSVSKEEIYMDNLIFFVLGFVLALILVKKPLQFVVHHKNENIIPVVPDVVMPKMADVINEPASTEDKVYEEMGKVMDNVQEIFGGSDRV